MVTSSSVEQIYLIKTGEYIVTIDRLYPATQLGFAGALLAAEIMRERAY